jgi:hypothetical protein
MSSTLAKKLAKIKPGTLYVGVDLALEHSVAMVLDERAKRLGRYRFPNDRDGYDYFWRVGGHGADQLLLEVVGG